MHFIVDSEVKFTFKQEKCRRNHHYFHFCLGTVAMSSVIAATIVLLAFATTLAFIGLTMQ